MRVEFIALNFRHLKITLTSELPSVGRTLIRSQLKKKMLPRVIHLTWVTWFRLKCLLNSCFSPLTAKRTHSFKHQITPMPHLLAMYLKNYLPAPASPAFTVGIFKVLVDFTMVKLENLLLNSAEKCQDKIIFETKQFMQLSAHD